MEKQVILFIFILVVYHFVSNNTIESFRSKRQNKNKNDKKNNKNNKEDFGNMSIPNLFKTLSSSDEKRRKFIEDIDDRERKRHELIVNKPSKNTKDSMKKFYALRDGFYDIMKLNLTR